MINVTNKFRKWKIHQRQFPPFFFHPAKHKRPQFRRKRIRISRTRLDDTQPVRFLARLGYNSNICSQKRLSRRLVDRHRPRAVSRPYANKHGRVSDIFIFGRGNTPFRLQAPQPVDHHLALLHRPSAIIPVFTLKRSPASRLSAPFSSRTLPCCQSHKYQSHTTMPASRRGTSRCTNNSYN